MPSPQIYLHYPVLLEYPTGHSLIVQGFEVSEPKYIFAQQTPFNRVLDVF